MGSRVAAGGEATKPSKSRKLNSAYHLGISIYPGKSSGLRFGARAGGASGPPAPAFQTYLSVPKACSTLQDHGPSAQSVQAQSTNAFTVRSTASTVT